MYLRGWNKLLLAGIGLLLIGLVAYVAIIASNRGEEGKTTVAGYALGKQLPDYARQDDYTMASYMTAVEMPEALEMIPCYCGCEALGHEELEDCFLQGEGFNAHAAGCGICKVEAVKAAEWLLEGRSIKEVRAAIDQQFGNEHYGRPTPTPQVSEDLYLADLAPALDQDAFQHALAELLAQ